MEELFQKIESAQSVEELNGFDELLAQQDDEIVRCFVKTVHYMKQTLLLAHKKAQAAEEKAEGVIEEAKGIMKEAEDAKRQA